MDLPTGWEDTPNQLKEPTENTKDKSGRRLYLNFINQ